MDVQPTDLQSATTMRLEQGWRDDGNEREGNSERERAEESRLLVERGHLAPVRAGDSPRVIPEPDSGFSPGTMGPVEGNSYARTGRPRMRRTMATRTTAPIVATMIDPIRPLGSALGKIKEKSQPPTTAPMRPRMRSPIRP